MIDHVLGRPSVKSRRLQVLAVLAFWSAYIFKGHKHGPPLVRFFSRFWTKRLTAWQTVIVTMIYLYAARNFSTLVGLASPEPMANMYTTTFFRATWVLTAMDAGFWTAMKIRTKWLRDLSSVVFSVFYLVAAERADEKVRKIRSTLTVEHLRVSWNKGTTPYLRFLQGIVRPRLTRWPPRAIRIPRPAGSDYKDPVAAWLYYDGPVSDLERHTKVVLDIPGGGFVAMDPRCNDDKLFAWAVKTGLPVLSLDYKKAPEYPYPYALNECFDVYTTIMRTKGRCLGMSGRDVPRVMMTGDSAGGNLATATTLMIIERTSPPMNRYMSNNDLPLPDGLVLFYPALDMNIGNWMSDEQMSLIRDRSVRGTNRRIVRRKSMQYNELVGTPHPSEDEDDAVPPKAGAPLELDLSDVIEASTSPEGSAPASQMLPPQSPQPKYSHIGPQSLSKTTTTVNNTHSAATSAATPEDPTPKRQQSASHRPEPLRTRLAMSSMISYTNDRVLTPEMMRAMIILYIGPHNRPDFSQDYLLSPVLAPDALLARFPKTYFLTGERDPLVDDTVIFAARLRKIKEAQWHQQRRAAAGTSDNDTDATTTPRGGPAFNDKDVAVVALLPGISHGFLQYPAIYPPAWGLIDRCVEWIGDIFAHTDAQRAREREHRVGRSRRPGEPIPGSAPSSSGDAAPRANGAGRHHVRTATESSADDDRPLEMAMTSRSAKAKEKEKEKTSDERRKSPPKTNGASRRQSEQKDEEDDDEGDDTKPARKRNGRLKAGGLSMVKLKSSEDLLGRRMHGLAGGLTGVGEQE